MFRKTSSTAIHSIFHDHLKLRKVYARWIPHHLTNDQKQMRIQFQQKSVEKIWEKQFQCIFDIITGDELWFYHYDSETKEKWNM